MNEEFKEITAIEKAGHNPDASGAILAPDVSMLILTWVTFFLLLAVLYKFAWKPILTALDAREDSIKKSLDDAQKAREELTQVTKRSQEIVRSADEQAKMVVERSRKSALEAAKAIEQKTKHEATIIMENAQTEIENSKKNARVALRQESADLAVKLAEKILKENLNKAKHEQLIDRFIAEFDPEEYEKR